MPIIRLETAINAPVQRCFDLSRSIDFHQESSKDTGEVAIAGVTQGLIQEGEQVTWRARHFGVSQTLTVQIISMTAPSRFEDRMLKGAFKSMRHVHEFTADGDRTIMSDVFEFESPLGILGHLANRLFLTAYMKKFLEERNAAIKRAAESEEWRTYLG